MSKLKTYQVLYQITEGRRGYIKARSAKLARERAEAMLAEGFDIDDSDVLHGDREVIDVEEVQS
ncbi:MAG: hypothetical protein ACLPWS_10805 [Rhodomicrobium sp.]